MDLHLFRTAAPKQPRFPVAGTNRVERMDFDEAKGRIYINAAQHFDGVSPAVWNYHVGGYQVAHKWLKDRKGRALTYDDIDHYGRVLAVLAETLLVEGKIDEAIGGWPIA